MQDYEAEAEAAGEAPTLAGFLERVTLVSDVDALKDEPRRVTLMTVHGAKGLEFELVLLTGHGGGDVPVQGRRPGRERGARRRAPPRVRGDHARPQQLAMTHTQMRQIFGTTRWNRPSRFLGELPAGVAEHIATGAMAGEVAFRPVRRPRRGASRERSASGPGATRRRRRTNTPAPGPRFVDHEFFDDRTDHVTDMPLRRGARVRHERFGDGEVLSS